MNFKQEPEGIFCGEWDGMGRSLKKEGGAYIISWTKEGAESRAGMEVSCQSHSLGGMMFLLPLLFVLLRSKF